MKPTIKSKKSASTPSGLWALISGGSRGIGWRLAEHAASAGYHVFLLGRDDAQLRQRVTTLQQDHPSIQARYLVVDLMVPQAASEVLQVIEQENLPIALWINNAGQGLAGAFSDHGIRDWRRLVQLNVVAGLELTHGLLPMLLVQRGGMIHVASIVAFGYGPRLAIYYACKAFMRSFYEAYAFECRDLPIRQLVVYPGPTRDTDFAHRAGMTPASSAQGKWFSRWTVLSAQQVAKQTWHTYAYRPKKHRLIPGLSNRLWVLFLQIAPYAWICKLTSKHVASRSNPAN